MTAEPETAQAGFEPEPRRFRASDGWEPGWGQFREKTVVLTLAMHGGVDGQGAYLLPDDANPFASLMEAMGPGVRTIWGEKHVDIERLAPLALVGGAPAWMQLVHGSNVSNRIKGRRVRLDSYCDLFPNLKCLSESVKESGAEIKRENSVVLPLPAGP